jgi:hypothetical protein
MFLQKKISISFFRIKINSFHLFGISGYLLGTLLGVWLCYFLGLDVKIILLMTIVGAATFFFLAFAAKMITGRETIVYYHHEIAILILCSIVLKLLGVPVLVYLDITILGIASFLSFGRIGCFSVGCCHGKPAKRGVKYDHHHVLDGFPYYLENVTLFPIQLIESLFVFLVTISGSLMLLQRVPPGTVLIFYTVVYGSFRFIVEFFRGDAERPYFKGLSEAQWTTLALLTVSLIFGFAGFVPFYYWHFTTAISIWIVSLFIIIISKENKNFFAPRHVMQIASGLIELRKKSVPAPNSILMFRTNLGFVFSKGETLHDGFIFIHYTVSSKWEKRLDFKQATKLGSLIKNLQGHKNSFLVRGKQNGVFHIIFNGGANETINIENHVHAF